MEKKKGLRELWQSWGINIMMILVLLWQIFSDVFHLSPFWCICKSLSLEEKIPGWRGEFLRLNVTTWFSFGLVMIWKMVCHKETIYFYGQHQKISVYLSCGIPFKNLEWITVTRFTRPSMFQLKNYSDEVCHFVLSPLILRVDINPAKPLLSVSRLFSLIARDISCQHNQYHAIHREILNSHGQSHDEARDRWG